MAQKTKNRHFTRVKNVLELIKILPPSLGPDSGIYVVSAKKLHFFKGLTLSKYRKNRAYI
jgi:hypothetical protein